MVARARPKCSLKSSKLEIRVYTEFKAIFDEVKWRTKINGYECDVFLPNYKLGIEIDGGYYHENRQEKDKVKGENLREMGISLFRLRNKSLGIIDNTDILYRYRESHFSILARLLKTMLDNFTFKTVDYTKIFNYIKAGRLRNSREYRKILSYLPSPPYEESLQSLYPELSKEWNYEKNAPLEPYMFSPDSTKKVWWDCERGHEWIATINSRTRLGRGCKQCYHKNQGEIFIKAIIQKRGSLEDVYPEIAKDWHPTKNSDLKPSMVTPRSGKKVWWMCEKGHEWEQTVHDRTRPNPCPECYKERKNLQRLRQTSSKLS